MGFSWAPTLYEAQLAIAEHPDFKGEAVAVPIHPFVDPLIESTTKKHNQMKGARSKWRKDSGYDERMKQVNELTGDARREALEQLRKEMADWEEKYLREHMTPEEYHAQMNHISAFGYHFSGSAKFFARAGDAFARALQEKNDR
jgi:molecular chaperone GrpE (heat shock protein)